MKIKQILLSFLFTLIAATWIQPANAALLSFTLSGRDNATFTLNSNPMPAGQVDIGFGDLNPYFVNVVGTFNGASQTFEYLTFYRAEDGGGFSAGLQPGDDGTSYFNVFDNFPGTAIFGGTVSAPTFEPGVFQFFDALDPTADPIAPFDTLTITGVPEPSTWALMIMGFVSIGVLTFRRKRKSLFSRA